jgi:serine protease Do
MKKQRRRFGSAALLATCLLAGAIARPAAAQDAGHRLDALRSLNASVESLVKRVSQSVVQVLVTSYGPVEESGRANTDLVIGRQRSMGSGVVIDAGGYIVTNAHVISNARRVEVVLPGRAPESGTRSLSTEKGRTVDATIVGIARGIDLALLKVDASDLTPIPIADYDALRQGDLVFAFGSPEGLRNSVTMGIVSAVARQPDPDNPLVYVQTDAPINHGNSGGPLVNVMGELVGINTFIVSESGGSQGLGFAIPSALVQTAYPKIRRYGHLHRGEAGLILQTVTPTLASALGLSHESGAMISDVMPGSAAESAGIRIGDIVVGVDGKRVETVPDVSFELFTRSAGDRVTFDLLRGDQKYAAAVVIAERPHDFDRLSDLVQPDKSRIERLGILAVDVNAQNAHVASGLRIPSGVMVVGRAKEDADFVDTGLTTGDTIHSINGFPIASLDDVRTVVASLKPRSAVALQIERNGQLIFVSFEME